jgi:AcrR family transcriptional regulator
MAELPDHLRSSPVGHGRVSQEVMSSHQRERVVALVTPVFAKRGYAATTVNDLLAAGKVGVGNFYELFEGKEECFAAAFERVLAEAREEVEIAAAPGADWAERSFLGLHGMISFIIARPLEARLVLLEAQSAGESALARYDELLDTAVAWLRRGRKESREADRLPQGFERASISGLTFYLQQCLLDRSSLDTEVLFGELAGLILEPIVGTPTMARLRDSLLASV